MFPSFYHGLSSKTVNLISDIHKLIISSAKLNKKIILLSSTVKITVRVHFKANLLLYIID